MNLNNKKNVDQITEHLFRNFYQEVFSSLVVKFGSVHLEIIEDALQETFLKAMKSWNFNQCPNNPKGWLFTVAKNLIVNQLKRNTKTISFDLTNFEIETITNEINEDAQLQLLLACSKLKLKDKAKLVFTLKAICGFGVSEIAMCLLISEENVYKLLQRAKQKLRLLPKSYFDNQSIFKFSNADINYLELIIYFMFNEGYDSLNSSFNEAINKEICFEAVRLAHLLAKKSDKKSTKHLLSLCYFHMARFESRVNVIGEFVSLRSQDRSKWDGELIQFGFRYLQKPKKLNRYYIEALIASIHIGARTFSETNWEEIFKLYNALLQIIDTPVIRLNRSICMFELGMNDKALKELKLIQPLLENNYLYFSVSMAEYLEDKDVELAKHLYKRSFENTRQDFRRQLIRSKLDKISSNRI